MEKVLFDTYHGLGHPVGERSSLQVPRTHVQTLTKTYVVFFEDFDRMITMDEAMIE